MGKWMKAVPAGVSQTRFCQGHSVSRLSVSIVSHTRGLSNLLIFQGDVSVLLYFRSNFSVDM